MATKLLIETAGYVALLLWGLHMVQTGMVRGFGSEFRQALRAALGNRIRAFASGFVITALLQSSTATALMLAGFLGSGFVPPESMPAGVRWFAEYQPFTPIIETLRCLLMDKPIGNNAWIALAWCALIALGGYLWSKRLFNREFSR